MIKGKSPCKQIFPPRKDGVTESDCDLWWEKSKKLLNERGDYYDVESALEDVDQIHIKKTFRSAPIVCYNPAIWKKKGWCELEKAWHWGICSPSCQYLIEESVTNIP